MGEIGADFESRVEEEFGHISLWSQGKNNKICIRIVSYKEKRRRKRDATTS
jgi:hypothetical protein